MTEQNQNKSFKINLSKSPLRTGITTENLIKNFLDFSNDKPLLISQQQQQNEATPPSSLSSSSASIQQYNNTNNNSIINKDFPFDIGRQILTDTIHYDYVIKPRYNQQNINDTITKQFLLENDFTLERLISDYEIPISDLFKCKIITSSIDLKDFGFKASDLVINRNCFNVNHLSMLFKLKHENILHMNVLFNIATIKECNFTFNELQTIKFSFSRCFIALTNAIDQMRHDAGNDMVIMSKNKIKTDLFSLDSPEQDNPFSYDDLTALGLEDSHLHYLGVTQQDIKTYTRWDKTLHPPHSNSSSKFNNNNDKYRRQVISNSKEIRRTPRK